MGSASLSRSERNSDILSEDVLAKTARRKRTAEKEETSSKINVSENPFFQTLFNATLSAEQRQAEVKSMLVSSLDARKDREHIRQFEELREWLAEQTTEHAEQIIAATNVDAMSEMQAVIDQLAGDLVNFEDLMGPIMEIIESIFKLRTAGKIEDAYREIERQRELEAKRLEELAKTQKVVERTRAEIDKMKRRSVELKESRGLFGFGGPTRQARIEMGHIDNSIIELAAELEKNEELSAKLSDPSQFQSSLADNAKDVANLKNLLDMTKDENRDRMIQLREAGTRFINTAKERTGSLRTQFTTTADLIDKIQDNNSGMTKVYAILYDGLSAAEKENADLRSSLANENEGESLIQRQAREEKIQAIDGHATMLKMNEADTLATYADLRQQAVRVDTMRNGIAQQVDTARKLNTQGVSATADRIMTVLTAIGAAGMGEASSVAGQMLQNMRNSTNEVAKREVVRVALGIEQLADSLIAAVDEIEDITEIQQHATAIARNGVAELNDRMAIMRQRADELTEGLKASRAVVSESATGADAAVKTETTSAAGNQNLFANL